MQPELHVACEIPGEGSCREKVGFLDRRDLIQPTLVEQVHQGHRLLAVFVTNATLEAQFGKDLGRDLTIKALHFEIALVASDSGKCRGFDD